MVHRCFVMTGSNMAFIRICLFPWTRIDHNIAYKLYFARNPTLIKDFRWDNCDGAIPDIGHFASQVAFWTKW